MQFRYTFLRIATLLASSMLVVACASAPVPQPTSGSASPAKSGVQTPAATSAPAAAAAAAPAAKQEIVIVQGADPETLDPQATTTRSTLNVSGAICEPLVKVAFADSGASSVAGVLATSWKLLNDTTWQFKLRENVKFSNGEPFDANAVKYSMDRIMDASNKWPSLKYVANIDRVDVVDKSTVNMVTKAPAPLLPLDLTQVYMVPSKYTAEVGKQTFANKPIGTGPFKLVEWVKDDHVTLEQNPDYWGGKPKLTKVTFKPVPEASTRTAAIITHQADVVIPLQISDINQVQQSSGLKVEKSPTLRLMYVVLDQASNDIMKNTKVRQALNYAVDKDAIVEHIFQGYGKKLQGQGLTPEFYGFNPDLQAYPYDPAKAKQLLAEAGYPDGFSATMWSPRGRYPLDFETAQAVAGQLEKVGVKVTVKPLEWAVYIQDFSNKKLTPMLFAAWGTYPDADPMFDAFLKGGVYSYADLPAFDKLVRDARSTMDEKKRQQMLQEAAKLQHDEALAIFLHQLVNIYAINDRVQGFKLLPNEAIELQDVYMK